MFLQVTHRGRGKECLRLPHTWYRLHKCGKREAVWKQQLTLYEDPIPVDFPDLTAPKKHQVGQDQHGGGTRGKSSVQSPASSWGEKLGLGEKGEKASHHKGGKKSGWDVTQPFCYQLRMPPSRAWGRLLFKQLFFFFFFWKITISARCSFWSKERSDTLPSCFLLPKWASSWHV